MHRVGKLLRYSQCGSRRQFFSHRDIDVVTRALSEFEHSLDNNHAATWKRMRKPLVDVVENSKNIQIIAELPGFKRENVDIEVNDRNVLTIRGVNTVEQSEDDSAPTTASEVTYHVNERSSMKEKFERKFHLPDHLQLDQIQAKMKDGLLTLSIPKIVKSKPMKRTISISSEE